MTETTVPSAAVQTAWARLVRAADIARAGIEADLKAAGLPGLDRYDVLWELERAGAPVRQGELGSRLLLERYNLSRRLDRMAADGLVERRACADDARAAVVVLTSKGRELRARMWPVYAAALQERVGDKLSGREAAVLGELLLKLM
jgi:DNA-binding MarR family transcriptional regulator